MVQSRHYPFCHRKNALVYPWSGSFPAFTNFNAFTLGQVSVSNVIRLGSTMLTDLTDMLSATLTTNERKVPHSGFTVFYELTDLTPAAISPWVIGQKFLRIAFRPYFRTYLSNIEPITRPRLRNDENAWAVWVSAQAFLSASDFINNYTVNVEATWDDAPTSVGDFSLEGAAIPTVYRDADPDRQEFTISFTSITPSPTSTVSFGSVPANVITYMDNLAATVSSELTTASLSVTYRMGATPGGIWPGTVNSTGTDSLADWVPVLY